MAAVMESRTVSTDRIFYTGMSLVAVAIVAVGFSPTFFLRSAALPPLSPLLTLHGVVFSTWMALFVAQTSLVALDRRDLHRRLGVAAAAVGILMVVLGTMAAAESMRLGRAPIPGLDPRSFFAVPMRDMLVFPILLAAGVGFRADAQTHKRLMLLATISILDAALARFPFAAIKAVGPPAFYAMEDLLIVAGIVYDRATRGRVHRAYVWGGLLIVLTQPLFLVLSGTRPWLAFADWVLAIVTTTGGQA